MGQFAYAFSLTLLHSIWQSAMLFLVYALIRLIIKGQLPSARRNFLYVLLLAQLLISVITFQIYYSGSESLYEPLAALNYAAVFTKQPVFQMIAPWILFIYLLIIAYKSLSLIYHWNNFKKNCRDTYIKPSIELKLFATVKANELGIRRKVKLWFSNNISTPVTFGFFKPVVLMPVALLNQLSLEEAETLILHELTHIKNHDYLLNFILIISDTLFFFNPFIKIITAHIKLEREKNCDVQVLHYKYAALNYAETLLKTARFKPGNKIFQLAAVSRNEQLLNRILFFTSEKNLHFRKNNYSGLTYLLVLLVLCVNFLAITEINRDKIQKDISYAPVIMPGYNADKVYSFFTDQAAAAVSPLVRETMNNAQSANSSVTTAPVSSKKHRQAKELTAETEESTELLQENFAIPAAAVEPVESKQVIISEENSLSGKSVTKAFKMVFVNGQWTVQPMWTYTESRILKDSIQTCQDSTIRAFQIIQ